MTYGSGQEKRDALVRCEMCRKWVESEKKITLYGPDTVAWGKEQNPRPHWFCSRTCVDQHVLETKEDQ